MSPSHVRKRGIKYRYYLSSALLQGRPKQAGTVSRIPAREVETLIAEAVRTHLGQPTEIEDTVLINTHVVRVEVQPDQLVIELAGAEAAKSKRTQKRRHVIKVPWRKTPSTRRREVLVPDSGAKEVRPIRSESRALLVASIALGVAVTLLLINGGLHIDIPVLGAIGPNDQEARRQDMLEPAAGSGAAN